jgi:hypothetical protein
VSMPDSDNRVGTCERCSRRSTIYYNGSLCEDCINELEKGLDDE